MSDTKDNDQGQGQTRTLSLKRRDGGGGTVRQSFSHGRAKTVVVEKKRKRIAVPGTPGESDDTPQAAAPAAQSPEPAAARPQATQAPVQPQRPQSGRGGVVLRTLTEEEKQARARALSDSRVQEAEERRVAEEESRRRAEEEVRLTQEREEAERRRKEEEARVAREDDVKRRTETEARRRLDDGTEAPSTSPAAAAAPGSETRARPGTVVIPPAHQRTMTSDDDDRPRRASTLGGKTPLPAKKPAATPKTDQRRQGKLTLTRALDDTERTRSLASVRRRAEREKRMARGQPQEQTKVFREVVLPETISVQDLAARMSERAVDVIKELMKQGNIATVNSVLDADTAQLIAEELGHTVKRVSESDVEEGMEGIADRPEDLEPRAPIVTIMGHVDHGKTSLLDALRATDVAAGEAGGITQHIGAYQVRLPSGQQITFLDTPGHAAFTAMRSRGAKVTDIVVLVVAADDGVMPQTVEAIAHAKAAKVPIIVAINKIDKPDANPQRVKTELLQHEIVVEDMGGDVQTVEVSAIKKINLDKLEEAILLQAEVLELRVNPKRPADGAVVEAKLDKGRGPVATVLVQRGTVKTGDIVVAGAEWGRVRLLQNDRGETVPSAGPGVPVEVLGLSAAPEAGDRFQVVENESRARDISAYRQRKKRDGRITISARGSLEQMLTQIQASEIKELPLVIKGDVQGSVEAVAGALEKLSTDEVKVRILHAGIGGVTESDVILAEASKAPILAFNVRANAQARERSNSGGVEIRYYSIIYNLVDDVRAAMSGLLSPTLRENFLGNAEILQVFVISKIGKVAGCRVTEGVVKRGAKVRLIRDNVVIHEGTLSTLKRFKDEVREVQVGQECGMAFENYHDLAEGDVIECFEIEEIARTL